MSLAARWPILQRVPSVQSDIYSLGVLLYQLLADRLGKPMAPGWEADIEDPLLRQDITDATHGNRDRRLPSAQLLAERLRGLPQRREELERIRGEQQRAASAQQALERSQARRPWLIAASALLILGLAVSSYFYLRERTEAREAREQAQISQALNDFVTHDVLEAANLDKGGNKNVTLKDAIVKSIPKIQQRFQQQPLIEASIDKAVGEALGSNYDAEDELPVDERAARIYEQLYGPEDSRTLDARSTIADDQLSLDHPAEATKLIDSVLKSWASKNDPLNPGYLKARSVKLWIMSETGTLPDKEAVALFRSLLSDAQSAHMGIDFMSSLEVELVLDMSRVHQDQEAEQLARSYLPELEKAYGPYGRPTCKMRLALAELEVYHNEFGVAEKDLQVLHAEIASRQGSNSQMALSALESIAQMQEYQGHWQTAVDIRKQILDGERAALGDAMAIAPAGAYAWDLDHLGRDREALPLLEKTVADARTMINQDESQFRSAQLFYLIYTLVRLDRLPDADGYMRELADLEAKRGVGDLETPGFVLLARGYLEKARGNVPAARNDARQAVAALADGDQPDPMFSMKSARELLESLPDR